MELVRPSKGYILKELLKFKLKTHMGSFLQLTITEIVILALTFYSGSMQMGSGKDNINLEFIVRVPNILFIITLFWLFVVCIQLPRKEQRKAVSTMIYNNSYHMFSDVFLIAIFSVTIAFTATMCNYLQAMIDHLFIHSEYIIGYTIWNAPIVTFHNLVTMTSIAFAVGTLSYVFCLITQFSKWLLVLVIAFLLIFKGHILNLLATFFKTFEPSKNVWSFNLPFLILSFIFVIIAFTMSKKMEVKE